MTADQVLVRINMSSARRRWAARGQFHGWGKRIVRFPHHPTSRIGIPNREQDRSDRSISDEIRMTTSAIPGGSFAEAVGMGHFFAW